MRWCCSGSYASSFTPSTIVMSGSVAGAEMTTLLAPAVRCCEAPSRSVKSPVDSTTTSTPISFQGSAEASRSESTRKECAVDRDLVLGVADLALEHSVRRVVLEHVREHIRRREVVDGDDLEARALLQPRPVEVPPDPAEAVDPDLGRHARESNRPSFEGWAASASGRGMRTDEAARSHLCSRLRSACAREPGPGRPHGRRRRRPSAWPAGPAAPPSSRS